VLPPTLVALHSNSTLSSPLLVKIGRAASAIFSLIFLLIFLISGFFSVYLALNAGDFHMMAIFAVMASVTLGAISLTSLVISIAISMPFFILRKKQSKALPLGEPPA